MVMKTHHASVACTNVAHHLKVQFLILLESVGKKNTVNTHIGMPDQPEVPLCGCLDLSPNLNVLEQLGWTFGVDLLN